MKYLWDKFIDIFYGIFARWFINQVILITVKEGLKSGKGVGVPAQLFINTDSFEHRCSFTGDETVFYDVFTEPATSKYYIVTSGIVVSTGSYSVESEDFPNEILADYFSNARFSESLTLAALGHWKESKKNVKKYWKIIITNLQDSYTRINVVDADNSDIHERIQRSREELSNINRQVSA